MRILKDGNYIEINGAGLKLGDLLRSSGLLIDMRCGGNGTCGRCEVTLLKGRYSDAAGEFDVSSPRQALACNTSALSEDCEISIPEESLVRENPDCLELFSSKLLPSAREPRKGLAFAVDVGTTTVATALIDLESGSVLATSSDYNSQLRYGDNVIARIAYASKSERKAKALQKAILTDTLAPLMKDAALKARRPLQEVALCAFSGNTVMLHLLFGLPTESLGHMPFAPFTLNYPETSARCLGLPLAPDAKAVAAPSASGFIGGDIVSGVFTSGLRGSHEKVALLDLGTNCETCLAFNGKLTACASAAGPAFEGARIDCGCRAAPGAIDRILIDASLNFQLSTIGGKKPNGICGSAMIDFLAEARRAGLLNEVGRLDMELLEAHGRTAKSRDGIKACRIDEAGKVQLSELDIEQLLKAKAAILSGLKTLCMERGMGMESLTKIILAGGFAQHINIENAIAIGMLPEIPLERYVKIGNSSLAGAVNLVLKPSLSKDFSALAAEIDTFVLNEAKSFEDNYIDALLLN